MVFVLVAQVVSDSLGPWTVAHQAPLSIEFPRKEYWSELHSLLQVIFLTQESNLGSPALRADSLPSEPPGKPLYNTVLDYNKHSINGSSYLKMRRDRTITKIL